jgi:hypothetical protein
VCVRRKTIWEVRLYRKRFSEFSFESAIALAGIRRNPSGAAVQGFRGQVPAVVPGGSGRAGLSTSSWGVGQKLRSPAWGARVHAVLVGIGVPNRL